VRLSCPRFLWTPYCPEKLEDDSVEGDGKTMIGAAGLVGSEGERGSSMLAITGQAAGAGPLAPGQRWSLARKYEVVLRLLRGEPVEAVSRQVGVPVWQLERWRARAFAGLKTGLRERAEDPAERELAEAHRRIGELSMEVELLRARIERPGPLARRRSR
jgi:transposase